MSGKRLKPSELVVILACIFGGATALFLCASYLPASAAVRWAYFVQLSQHGFRLPAVAKRFPHADRVSESTIPSLDTSSVIIQSVGRMLELTHALLRR